MEPLNKTTLSLSLLNKGAPNLDIQFNVKSYCAVIIILMITQLINFTQFQSCFLLAIDGEATYI